MRYLELLAPAKNLECGIAAIDSGADAVYIGADRFGARQSAGNSITDIAALTEYAHKFGCKVFVTVNTIIYDNELDSTQDLINELGKIGVDAILVQDMGLLKLSLPEGVALHASTQTDNRTADKVKWLSALGFERVVLATRHRLTKSARYTSLLPKRNWKLSYMVPCASAIPEYAMRRNTASEEVPTEEPAHSSAD